MDENNYCVYIHTNKINGKKYIGISSNVKKRWANKGKNYYDQVFGLAIQKYGWDNFEHKIVKNNISKEEACDLEQELIKKYNTRNKELGYNRSDGGDCGSKGAYNAQLKRIKKVYQYDMDGNYIKEFTSIAEALREVAPHIKSSGNITLCCKGKRHNAYGFQWSYEYNGDKIDRCLTREEITSSVMSMPVYQYSLSGDYIREYKSISEAKNITGLTGIQYCISGVNKTSGGFQWFNEYMGEKVSSAKSVSEKSSETNSKKVYMYNNDKQLLQIFVSCKKACKFLSTYQSKIKKCVDEKSLFDDKYYLSYIPL